MSDLKDWLRERVQRGTRDGSPLTTKVLIAEVQARFGHPEASPTTRRLMRELRTSGEVGYDTRGWVPVRSVA